MMSAYELGSQMKEGKMPTGRGGLKKQTLAISHVHAPWNLESLDLLEILEFFIFRTV